MKSPHRSRRIMRLTCFACSLILPGASIAQSNGVLEQFQGGIIGADLRITSSGLIGFAGGFEGIGGSMSQITPGGESVRWNPVGLAYVRESTLYSEWSPPIRFDLNNIYDVESRANEALREGVSDLVPENQPGAVEDFVIRPRLGLEGGQGNYAGVLKTRYFTLGGAIHSPTRLIADIGISGTRFRAATASSGGGTTIRMLGIMSGTLSTEFSLSGFSLALAKNFGHGLAIGVGMDSYSADFSTRGSFQPEAQVSSGAQEFAFNSPSASHYDQLRAGTSGLFEGEGVRMRVGAGFHAGNRFAVDFAWFSPHDILFNGQLTYAYDQVLAFDLGANENEVFFDAGQLISDDFTGTHPRTTVVSNLRLKNPGKIALAIAGSGRDGRGSIIYEHYYGATAFAFDYASSGDSTFTPVSGSRELGFEPQEGLYLNLGAQWLQLRFGAVLARFFNQHSRAQSLNETRSWLPIFGISGGFLAPRYKRFRLDYALTLGLTSFLRFGVSYAIKE